MNIKAFSNYELISRMEKLARTERKITHLVLLHIAEIEERRLFASLGFDGMYAYLTKGLGYSDGSAYRRLQSARLLRKVPEVAKKIEDGRLNLSQLTQVQKSLRDNDKMEVADSNERILEVLEKLECKNSFETQKVLAVEMDLPLQMHEKLKPQQNESVRLEITLTAEQFIELEQAKSLLSHVCPNGSWAEVIGVLAQKYNKQKSEGRRLVTAGQPMTKEESQAGKNIQRKTGEPIVKSDRRTYISVYTKRELLLRAKNCCEYRDFTGKACSSKYQLQVDHIRPLALGGGNEKENLRVLCRTHNILMAEKAGLKRA